VARFPEKRVGFTGRPRARNKWRTGRRRTGDGEDDALLAVTALETGNPAVAERAIAEAEKRGANMSALKERLPS
jgi:hypothetical protein